MENYLPHLTVGVLIEFLAVLLTFPWILTIKKDSSAAIAWCLIVLLVPLLGVTLFLIFGYTRVDRPVRRKRRHHARFVARTPAHKKDLAEAADDQLTGLPLRLGQIASRLGAFGPVGGNEVTLYHETQVAFDHLCDAIRDARRHIHLQYFIIQPDEAGQKIIDLLAAKAKEGVQVRLLYDAVGSRRLTHRMLRSLIDCNGKCRSFLGFTSLRRLAVNMRNHRKIAVIDGRVGFTGGANIGREYLGKDPHFGYWRDEQLRLEGPGVGGLQQIFVEDWDFATGEYLQGEDYFPELPRVGDATVQIIAGGPDQDVNSIRELVFSAVTMARERLWIASPYIVPDQGIMDALRFAARLGVDVRLLCPLKPDHWLTYYAGRYYFTELMAEGIKLYEYAKGMMHSKIILVDGQWASVGSANLDYRSLCLNFEANCLIHSPDLVAELEEAYRSDLQQSVRLELYAFRGRPFATRLLENGCRLLSPTL